MGDQIKTDRLSIFHAIHQMDVKYDLHLSGFHRQVWISVDISGQVTADIRRSIEVNGTSDQVHLRNGQADLIRAPQVKGALPLTYCSFFLSKGVS